MGQDTTYDIKSAKNVNILQLSVRYKIIKWRLTKIKTVYDCKSSEIRGEKNLNLIPRVITSKMWICFRQTEQLRQYVLCTVSVMYVDNKHVYTSRHILKDE